eukprot:1157677-Pelagomonas_calceolata.AAC.8
MKVLLAGHGAPSRPAGHFSVSGHGAPGRPAGPFSVTGHDAPGRPSGQEGRDQVIQGGIVKCFKQKWCCGEAFFLTLKRKRLGHSRRHRQMLQAKVNGDRHANPACLEKLVLNVSKSANNFQ